MASLRLLPKLTAVTLTAAVALAPVGPAHAQTGDLVPLEKFVANHQGHGDWAAMAYVAERCSALYYDYAMNLEAETDPQMQMTSKISMSQAQIFNQFAVKFNSQGTTANPTTIAETTNKYILDFGLLGYHVLFGRIIQLDRPLHVALFDCHHGHVQTRHHLFGSLSRTFDVGRAFKTLTRERIFNSDFQVILCLPKNYAEK